MKPPTITICIVCIVCIVFVSLSTNVFAGPAHLLMRNTIPPVRMSWKTNKDFGNDLTHLERSLGINSPNLNLKDRELAFLRESGFNPENLLKEARLRGQ